MAQAYNDDQSSIQNGEITNNLVDQEIKTEDQEQKYEKTSHSQVSTNVHTMSNSVQAASTRLLATAVAEAKINRGEKAATAMLRQQVRSKQKIVMNAQQRIERANKQKLLSKSNTMAGTPNYQKAIDHAKNRKSHIMLYVPQSQNTDKDAAKGAGTVAVDQTASFGNNGNSATSQRRFKVMTKSDKLHLRGSYSNLENKKRLSAAPLPPGASKKFRKIKGILTKEIIGQCNKNSSSPFGNGWTRPSTS